MVDVYSLGVVLHLMVNGRFPYRGNTEAEVKRKVLTEKLPEFIKGLSPECGDLLRRMLCKKPEDRIPIAEVRCSQCPSMSPRFQFASACDLAVAVQVLTHPWTMSALPENYKLPCLDEGLSYNRRSSVSGASPVACGDDASGPETPPSDDSPDKDLSAVPFCDPVIIKTIPLAEEDADADDDDAAAQGVARGKVVVTPVDVTFVPSPPQSKPLLSPRSPRALKPTSPPTGTTTPTKQPATSPKQRPRSSPITKPVRHSLPGPLLQRKPQQQQQPTTAQLQPRAVGGIAAVANANPTGSPATSAAARRRSVLGVPASDAKAMKAKPPTKPTSPTYAARPVSAARQLAVKPTTQAALNKLAAGPLGQPLRRKSLNTSPGGAGAAKSRPATAAAKPNARRVAASDELLVKQRLFGSKGGDAVLDLDNIEVESKPDSPRAIAAEVSRAVVEELRQLNSELSGLGFGDSDRSVSPLPPIDSVPDRIVLFPVGSDAWATAGVADPLDGSRTRSGSFDSSVGPSCTLFSPRGTRAVDDPDDAVDAVVAEVLAEQTAAAAAAEAFEDSPQQLPADMVANCVGNGLISSVKLLSRVPNFLKFSSLRRKSLPTGSALPPVDPATASAVVAPVAERIRSSPQLTTSTQSSGEDVWI